MPRPAATEITANIQNVTDAPVELAWLAASRCPAVTGPLRPRPPRSSPRGPPRRAGTWLPGLRAVGAHHPGRAELVVVPLGIAQPHGMRRCLHARLERRQQLLLGPDQAFPVVIRELVVVGHGQRAGRAGLHAQPAQDAAQVVDLIDGAVALPG